MKPVTLELMTNYRYLSDLKLCDTTHTLYFTETKADLENNDYKQRIHQLDTLTKESSILLDWKRRCSTFLMKDGSLIMSGHDLENPTVHTQFSRIEPDGSLTPLFTLPLSVGKIEDLDDTFYLVSATIHQSCPDYHHLTEDEKMAIEEKKKEDEDYVIFDEYPFFFNGAGIINGNRTSLFLVNKHSLEITDLVPSTVDVESYDVNHHELIYSGVDYTDVKGLWSWVWKINLDTLETEVLFDDVLMISRVFYHQDKVMVLGTNKTAVDGRDFYELKDKKLHLVLENEGSLYNSVGSDCRFGKTKNYYQHNDLHYFVSTEDSRSNLLCFNDKTLTKVTDFEGSVDDIVIGNDGIWIISLKDQKLQEVYEYTDHPVQRTSINESLFEDVYVAKPERLCVKKEEPIYGWILKPKDYDPSLSYPAILDIHGGPKTAYGEVFYHEMQAWASMGYFVMFCNPHCSDGRGNEFANYMKHYGATDYEDIMDFVDEVLKLYPQIDSSRVGVTGGSYGGYMTNWIIGHTNRFKCAASQRSVSNRITQMIYSDYGIDTPYEFGVEDINDCYDLFWDRSPIKYANNAVTPTLFIQATEDYRCPIPEAIQMYTVLKCRGVDTRLVAFKGENHDLSRTGKPHHRLRRLKEITDWMNKYLK